MPALSRASSARRYTESRAVVSSEIGSVTVRSRGARLTVAFYWARRSGLGAHAAQGSEPLQTLSLDP